MVPWARGSGKGQGRVWAHRLRRPGCDFRRRGGRQIPLAGGAESGVERRRSAIRILCAGLGRAQGQLARPLERCSGADRGHCVPSDKRLGAASSMRRAGWSGCVMGTFSANSGILLFREARRRSARAAALCLQAATAGAGAVHRAVRHGELSGPFQPAQRRRSGRVEGSKSPKHRMHLFLSHGYFGQRGEDCIAGHRAGCQQDRDDTQIFLSTDAELDGSYILRG